MNTAIAILNIHQVGRKSLTSRSRWYVFSRRVGCLRVRQVNWVLTCLPASNMPGATEATARMNKRHLALVSAFLTGLLAAIVGVSGLGGPSPLSAQSGTGGQLPPTFSNVPVSLDGTELMFNLPFTPTSTSAT